MVLQRTLDMKARSPRSSGVPEGPRKLAVVTGRRASVLRGLASDLEARTSARVKAVITELSNERDLAGLVRRVEKLQRVDVLVSNAGYGSGFAFRQAPTDDHLRMVARGEGTIVAVASLAAFFPPAEKRRVLRHEGLPEQPRRVDRHGSERPRHQGAEPLPGTGPHGFPRPHEETSEWRQGDPQQGNHPLDELGAGGRAVVQGPGKGQGPVHPRVLEQGWLHRREADAAEALFPHRRALQAGTEPSPAGRAGPP